MQYVIRGPRVLGFDILTGPMDGINPRRSLADDQLSTQSVETSTSIRWYMLG